MTRIGFGFDSTGITCSSVDIGAEVICELGMMCEFESRLLVGRDRALVLLTVLVPRRGWALCFFGDYE